MSFLVFRRCCFCVDLRLASILIAYSMLVLRVGVLVITSIRIANENSIIQHDFHSIAVHQDMAFHRLISIISLMILIFEILLTIALIVGLAKRLDQHLEMYYVGCFAFLVMSFVMYAVVLLRYAERFGAWAWLITAVEICMKLVQVYFLSVIRSYYFKMKEEIKEDEQRLDSKQPTNYFARTNPVLISSKP